MSISVRKREALFVHAEGRSVLSGEPLESTWEVDHKIPRAAGGSDDVVNLQAVTADENRAKSMAHPPRLRTWQEKFLDKWRRETASSFLLVALPAAGKTYAALTAAQEWITTDPANRKIVIVVPTDALRTQWQQEAAQVFGMQLQARDWSTTFKSQMAGVVLTYQGLMGHSQLWQLQCNKYQILAIFDEVHHAGDCNEWGFQLKECFSRASRRLAMSGTPFRGDNTRIPFVNYDGDGYCVPHDRYDYPEAIRDGVIRVVRFQHERGIVRQSTVRGEEQIQLSSDTSEDEANEALRQIIRPGRYTKELLSLANSQLRRCREDMPFAGGLVICADQDHAQNIAKQLEQVTGTPPDIIVSDDDRATSTVKEFRESSRQWVVAVRQISEGVDIKRLMVLVYLTNTRTPLFFRQAVGRIMRTLGTPEDMESYCFIPDHPTLVQHAQQITNAQIQALEDESDEECQRALRELEDTLFPSNIVLGTEHTGTAGTIIEGETLNPVMSDEVANISKVIKVPAHVALRIYKEYGRLPAPVLATEQRSPQRPLEDQLDDLGRALQRSVSRVSYRLLPDDGDRFKKINLYVNRFIGKRNRKDFTCDEYRRAIAKIETLKHGDAI